MIIPSRRHPAAFTLVELLAVITIIVILAGIVVGGLSHVRDKQAREKAKVQVSMLERAIDEYKLDMGAFPGTGMNFGGLANDEDGASSEVLYTALFYDGWQYTDPATPPTDWKKATSIYLAELDPRSSQVGWLTPVGPDDPPPANLKIKDPWGQDYRYRVGNIAQNPDFDLWSMGKDGKTDPANKLLDDVRNF
jgi:prepilin-type N-terminal cleavage/methylation domain-containing protein